MPDKFMSLNRETGLLEDSEEVKHVIRAMAEALASLVKEPLIELFLGPNTVLTARTASQVALEVISDSLHQAPLANLRTTGMLVISQLSELLTNPVILSSYPSGMLLDAVVLTASAWSFFTPVSQADQLRHLGMMLLMDMSEVEEQIKEYHLSETLPTTHPSAKSLLPELPDLDPNDPDVKGSSVMQVMLKKQQELKKEARTPIPDVFLKAFEEGN